MTRHRAGTAVIEKGQQSVDEILDAATALLAEEGYAELSTRKVAARAGMRPGNLQYYFPAKRDMVRALLERYLDASRQRLAARIETGDLSPEDRLHQAIESILAEQGSSQDCVLFREIWALAAHDAEVANAMADFYSQYRAHVATLLKSVNPQLAGSELQRLAAVSVAMLEGLSLFRGSDASPFLPEAGHLQEIVLLLAQNTGAKVPVTE
ncbi:MAG: TetR/AcrR family transcriptional regulator [bacterium]|nr:TetR/AcrR family transcriptional regulator [bacterium]